MGIFSNNFGKKGAMTDLEKVKQNGLELCWVEEQTLKFA